jgi:hypothetical protein
MNSHDTWRIRNIIDIILNKINDIDNLKVNNFLRCALLKTGQWAIDNRKSLPTVGQFRNRFFEDVESMMNGLLEYSRNISSMAQLIGIYPSSNVLHRNVIGIENEKILVNEPIKLVVTSPPYPGIHVLYHRWQIKGRKETPAPFWISGRIDGNGASFYTFGDRKSRSYDDYFEQIYLSFKSISNVIDHDAFIVQLVAFSQPERQLSRYLKVMEKAGFYEVFLTDKLTHKRIWRKVPNRKWYAYKNGDGDSSKEVVLIHRLK